MFIFGSALVGYIAIGALMTHKVYSLEKSRNPKDSRWFKFFYPVEFFYGDSEYLPRGEIQVNHTSCLKRWTYLVASTIAWPVRVGWFVLVGLIVLVAEILSFFGAGFLIP